MGGRTRGSCTRLGTCQIGDISGSSEWTADTSTVARATTDPEVWLCVQWHTCVEWLLSAGGTWCCVPPLEVGSVAPSP